MKTLGIIFRVAGVKEAQEALKNIRINVNQSLAENKKVIAETVKINNQSQAKLNLSYRKAADENSKITLENAKFVAKSNKSVSSSLKVSATKKTSPNTTTRLVPQRGEPPYDYLQDFQRTSQAIAIGKYQKALEIYARPRINASYGGFYEGIGNAAGQRAFDQIDSTFRKLLGIKEHRETIDLSNETINKIGDSVASSLVIDGGIKKRGAITERQRFQDSRKGVVAQKPGFISQVANKVTMPFRTINYAFYEGIGARFGDKFARGFEKVLNEELDIDFERKGAISGKAVAYTSTQGVEDLKGNVNRTKDDFSDLSDAVENANYETAAQKFQDLIKSITATTTSLADSYIRGFRKASVSVEAMRKIQNEITKKNNQAPDLTGKRKVYYTVSGFAGEKGKRGDFMASQLRPYVKDDVEVIGADNSFTDVLSPSDKNAALWGISALANLGKINLKGFNPDAVELAAKVINTIAQNPNIEVELLGHSAGGFVVEEAQELLDRLGYKDKIKTQTIGTPKLLGHLDNPNVKKIMGDNDFRIKPLEEVLEYGGLADPTKKIVSNVKDHFFQDYLNSEDFLNQVIGKQDLDKGKVRGQRKTQQKRGSFQGQLIELESLYVKYISKMYQNLDDIGEELSVAPDRLAAKFRRGRLREKGSQDLERKLRTEDYKKIDLQEGAETLVLVSGGLGGARGRSGAAWAKSIKGFDGTGKTQYVGVRNPFTDVLTPEDIRNQDSDTAAKTFISCLANSSGSI